MASRTSPKKHTTVRFAWYGVMGLRRITTHPHVHIHGSEFKFYPVKRKGGDIEEKEVEEWKEVRSLKSGAPKSAWTTGSRAQY